VIYSLFDKEGTKNDGVQCKGKNTL